MPAGRDPSKDRVQEDDPRWNSQTMGNRRRAAGSPNARDLVESGRLRMRAAPGTQKRPRTQQKMDFTAAVKRRLEANKSGKRMGPPIKKS